MDWTAEEEKIAFGASSAKDAAALLPHRTLAAITQHRAYRSASNYGSPGMDRSISRAEIEKRGITIDAAAWVLDFFFNVSKQKMEQGIADLEALRRVAHEDSLCPDDLQGAARAIMAHPHLLEPAGDAEEPAV